MVRADSVYLLDENLFLGGTIEAGPTTPTGDPFVNTATFRIGTTHNNVSHFNGWIDSFVYLPGVALEESNFTPTAGNIAVPASLADIEALPWVDFDDTMFEVTGAGTTGACIVPADFGIGNTHDQDSVEFTARNAWSRAVTVDSVGADPRRDFTVTELTPNSGHAPGAGPYPETLGFADDFFNGGLVVWETGNNAGIQKPMEIRDFIPKSSVRYQDGNKRSSYLP